MVEEQASAASHPGPTPAPVPHRSRAGSGPRSFRLDIGAVLGQSLRILGRNALPFLTFAFVVQAPISLYGIVVQHELWQARTDPETFAASQFSSMLGLFAVTTLGGFLVPLLLQIVTATGVYATLSGQPSGYATSLAGLRRFLPALGIALVVGLLTLLPWLPAMGILFLAASEFDVGAALLSLLFMAGAGVVMLIVVCTYYVPIQTTIVERTAVGASLRRSSFLTRGSRWRIFALILIVGMVSGAANYSVSGVLVQSAKTWNVKFVALLLEYAITAVTVTFNAIMAAVVYYELRRGKEGVDIQGIVKVFE